MGEITGLVSPPGGSQTVTVVVTASGDSTGVTDSASIIATANALIAAGGGILQLRAAKYFISSPLPMGNGLQYVGVAPQLNYTTNTAPIPDSNLVIANGGGTILQAVGSTACFQWNKTALGVPGSANAFVLTGLSSMALRNLCMNGFTRAVDGGNTNNAAAWYSHFDNLYISGCSDWGFWITNFQHCFFNRIYTFSCTTGGQFYGNDVPSSTLQPGNSVWMDLYNTTPSTNANLSRGIVYWIQQGQQNEGLILRLQSNRLNSSTVTQAATMANASANITVTDGTKFAVGMPVTFSATANGFFQNEIYFVTSVATNVITVSLTVGGSNVTATGSTAVNCITQGFAALECVALSGSAISSHKFNNVDVEAGGTCAIVAQNFQTGKFEISQVPLNNQSTQSFCARALQTSIVYAFTQINTSWDGNSGSSHLYGSRMAGSVGGGAVAHNPPGLYFDAGLNYTVMNLTASVFGWSNQTPDTTNMLIPLTGMVQQSKTKSASAVTIVGADSGWIVNLLTTGASTFTLPVVSSTIKGMQYRFINPIGTGQNLVVSAGAQNFFGASATRTSITMTPGSAMDVMAENDALGSYYAVGSLVGSYSAGTLTGVTP